MPSFKNVKKFGSDSSVNYLETVHSSFTHSLNSCNSVSLHMGFFFLLGHLMTWYSGISLLLTSQPSFFFARPSVKCRFLEKQMFWDAPAIMFQNGASCDDSLQAKQHALWPSPARGLFKIREWWLSACIHIILPYILISIVSICQNILG